MIKDEMEEWVESVPLSIRADRIWTEAAYRLALFAADAGWSDAKTLAADPSTRDLANQLTRALGSIAANFSEGYSRRTGPDRARFYGYSLGSSRESRTWYFLARHVLGTQRAETQIGLLTRLVQLLIVIEARSYNLRRAVPKTEGPEVPNLIEQGPKT